jgi:hypothetical protein
LLLLLSELLLLLSELLLLLFLHLTHPDREGSKALVHLP